MKSRRAGAHNRAIKSHAGERTQGATQQERPKTPVPPAVVAVDPLEGVSSASDKRAQVSFFITNAQKMQLHERGYSDEQIAKMKPAEAHKILGLQ